MKLLCILLFVSVVYVALARKPNKKPGKHSSKDLEDELEELRQELKELQAQVAAGGAKAAGSQDDSSVQVGNVHIHLHGNDSEVMSGADDPNNQHIHLHMHVDGCPDHDHDDDHRQPRRQHWWRRHNKTMATATESASHDHTGSLDKYVFENDPDEIHAHCDFIPNIDLPEKDRENPHGYVHFTQKKSRGPVEVDIHVDGFRVHDVNDDIHEHGMHVHEGSDPENGCDKLGGHFNPHDTSHGGPSTAVRHAGDLGNIPVDSRGNVHTEFDDIGISLMGPSSIIGHSVVIHSMADDLGTGTGGSMIHGNAGTRVTCCKIVKVSGDVIDDRADGHDHVD